MLAAQGYQESPAQPGGEEPTWGHRVMQVMPQTGAELKVGDIHQTEPNIHAGTNTWTSS